MTRRLTFRQHTFPNGLTVLGEENGEAHSVAAGFFVNTGARDESPELAGVSHFLEHMMYKGTERRTADEINREFDELGARYNAYTSEERTVYYGAVLPERLAALLDLLGDIMRPSLRESDFEVEKKVILEEIAMYHDRPNFRVFEEGNPRFYRGHPLGQSILGSPASIRALSRDQMLDYFRARYAANNLTLVVAGAFSWEEVLEEAERLTATWTPAEVGRCHPEFDPDSGRAWTRDASLARAHLALFAPGVAAQDERHLAAAILAATVGDSSGSRLYWSLVDPGLADAASLAHDASDGAGAFVAYVSTAPENLARVERLLAEELARLQEKGFESGEWERAQRKLASSLTLRAETPLGRLMTLGTDHLYGRPYRDVQALAASILSTGADKGLELLRARPFSQTYAMILSPGLDPAGGADG